jgi:hypothetical protein
MFVFTLDVRATAPVEAAITLVSESFVLPFAITETATTEASFCSASVQSPRRPVSVFGAAVLLAMSLVAAYFFESAGSVTTSPFV